MNKTEIAYNIHTIEKALSEGVRAQAQAKQLRDEVLNDSTRSESWKEKQYSAIDAALTECYLVHAEEIEALKEYFVTLPDMARAEFSYDDPELQTALSMCDSMRDKLPRQSKISMINRFKGNPGALDVLKAVFEKYNYPEEEEVKKALGLFSMFNNVEAVFDEFLASAKISGYFPGWEITVTPKWKDDIMRKLMNRFKYTFDVSTDKHPLIAEIESMRDKTEDTTIKLRIDRYLKVSAKDIEADKPEEIERAKRYIKEGFIRYIVL